MYNDMGYLLIAIISAVIGTITQNYIKKTYNRWSKVPASVQGTGAQVARTMLDTQGARAVGITQVAGHLTDYYDPRDNNLHLSQENYAGGSVASVAVACHEAGHAIQTAQGYMPVKLRTALVPVASAASNLWMPLLLGGSFLGSIGMIKFAILLFAVSVLFQVVTLPVEFDASRRAINYLSSTGANIDERGARQVLTAAALTYIAAALVSVLQLIYFLGQIDRDDS